MAVLLVIFLPERLHIHCTYIYMGADLHKSDGGRIICVRKLCAREFRLSASQRSLNWVEFGGWPEPYIYGVYTVFLAGKSLYIRSYMVHIFGSGQSYIYTVYIQCFLQGVHQINGHIRCIHTVFLAGKSPNIRSYTVYIQCFLQGNHQIYGHIRRTYTVLANPKYVACILRASLM